MKTHIIYLAIIAALSVLLFTCNRCNHPDPDPDNGKLVKVDVDNQKDTVSSGWHQPALVSIDTNMLATEGRIQQDPTYIATVQTKPHLVSVDTNRFTFGDNAVLNVPHDTSIKWIIDTSNNVYIPLDWFLKKFYSDTVLTRYGKMVIDDSVSENRILTRNVTTAFTIPVITKTIAERRSSIYFGGDVFGNGSQILRGWSACIGLENKRGWGYELGIMRLGTEKVYTLGVRKRLFSF
jgi:hypothetical protein